MQYTLKRNSRTKRVSIRLDGDGEVIVTAPERVNQKTIDQFITQQQAWIDHQRQQLQQKQNLVESDGSIMIFGIKYQKVTQSDVDLPQGIHIINDQVLLNFPYSGTSKQDSLHKKELRLFLKKSARTYLTQQAKLISTAMGLKYNQLTLRQQKTRWGSCSSQDNLSLNWRLVHYPPPLIDYVIIHELAHLSHHNHSKQFWLLVNSYDPLYKQHRQYLKKYGVTF
jgi:hypothetical protein